MLEHFQNPIQKSKKEANSIHNTHKCMTDHFSVLAELVLWTHIFALSEMMRSCKCFHMSVKCQPSQVRKTSSNRVVSNTPRHMWVNLTI